MEAQAASLALSFNALQTLLRLCLRHDGLLFFTEYAGCSSPPAKDKPSMLTQEPPPCTHHVNLRVVSLVGGEEARDGGAGEHERR